MSWTPENLRHVRGFWKQAANPAATVYDSIGADFPLALAPGWLNLGLWEDLSGPLAEAPLAVERLVREIAAPLPTRGVIVDVGNGLAAQDPVIADVANPERLVAINVTLSQLRAGRGRLESVEASGVLASATNLPLADACADGVISVEAAFHFPSRARFFDEAFRVLRPGGVLTMSDVPTERMPRTPGEVLAGIGQLRLWGLAPGAAASTASIAGLARTAGFTDVRTELCGDRVIDPALRFVRRRLAGEGGPTGLTRLQEVGTRMLVRQVELLRRRGVLEYVLLHARKP